MKGLKFNVLQSTANKLKTYKFIGSKKLSTDFFKRRGEKSDVLPKILTRKVTLRFLKVIKTLFYHVQIF